MNTLNISFTTTLALYSMLLIPISIFIFFGVKLNKKIVVGTIRMTVQLTLVGFYLQVIFKRNNLALNIAWVAIMIFIANLHVLKNAGLKIRFFFFSSLTSMTIGTFLSAGIFVALAIHPSPIYDARYMIPITGMILGNCLRTNILAMERFFSSLDKQKKTYETSLTMGATTFEALRPFIKEALTTSLTPITAMLATVGLVSLPGMMTGQILGGSVPFIAIKYQIGIMICIVTSGTLTATINIILGSLIAFDKDGNLRQVRLSD